MMEITRSLRSICNSAPIDYDHIHPSTAIVLRNLRMPHTHRAHAPNHAEQDKHKND